MENVPKKDIILKKTQAKADYKIQYFFSKILRAASLVKKNAPSTSSVKQTSKLIEKVTEDDCALKEIPAEIKMEKEENEESIVSVKNITFLQRLYVILNKSF